jgi:hypothetical protein
MLKRTGMRLALLAIVVVASIAGCSSGKPPGPGTPSGAGVPGADGNGGDVGVANGGGSAPTICAKAANLSPQGVSAIVDRKKLVLPDGTSYTLDAVPGGPVSGYQTCDGWLVRGFGNGVDTLSLWLVSPTGALRPIVGKADAPVAVGSDGRRLAWRSGGRVYFGRVDPTGNAIVDKSTPAPARGAPIAVGADSVVLGYSETGGGIDHHDTWVPSLGDYRPTWEKSADVKAVYSPGLADGTYLGLVQGPAGLTDTCLGVMNAKDSLKATKKACGIVTQIGTSGAVSVDGRWLAMHAASSSGAAQIAVLDLTKVFTTPAVTTTWAADGGWAWEDADNLLVATTAGLVRFHIGATTGEAVTRTGVTASSKVILLPRLG